MELIFGSVGMGHHWRDYRKTPKDIDILYYETHGEMNAEYHTFDGVERIFELNDGEQYMDKDLLYTFKVSHLAWEGKNGKWWKHLKDSVFMRNKGCALNTEVYELLYGHWCELHGDKSNISLDKAVEAFFKDGVGREYDHDWLHEYFKVEDMPAYGKIIEVAGKPLVSKELFSTIDIDAQMYTALEEMFVVSFERSIPLANAYKDLVTKMSKGWWNLFLIENAEQLLDGYKDEKQIYKSKVKELRDGVISSKRNN